MKNEYSTLCCYIGRNVKSSTFAIENMFKKDSVWFLNPCHISLQLYSLPAQQHTRAQSPEHTEGFKKSHKSTFLRKIKLFDLGLRKILNQNTSIY